MTRVGDGLIETMRVRQGRLPLLDRHLARLRGSLAALGRPVPSDDLTDLALAGAVPAEGGGGADHVVRLAVLDSAATIATRELPHLNPPVVIVATEPHAPYPHKTTAREVFDRALAEAHAQGADDALLVTPGGGGEGGGGHIAEGTTWNVFWWEGDRLYTPALNLGILPGVGRARVMELAEVAEVRVTAAEFGGRSMFLVNAVRGIVPIGAFRGRDVPLDARTAELSHRFWPD
jgi:branched-subunit amino acid aminotransferase/4-amino-4-deoxychorismate lyase